MIGDLEIAPKCLLIFVKITQMAPVQPRNALKEIILWLPLSWKPESYFEYYPPRYQGCSCLSTVCPLSLGPFYTVTYNNTMGQDFLDIQ